MELTFQADQNPTDGALSDQHMFRMFEGDTGQSVLMSSVVDASAM